MPASRLPRPAFVAGAAFVLLLVTGGIVTARLARKEVGAQPDGSVLVPTNQSVTPIGVVRRLEGARPKDLAVSPDGRLVAVLATNRVSFFDREGAPAGEVSIQSGALGIAWAPDGSAVYASSAGGKVYRIEPAPLRAAAGPEGKWQIAGDYPAAAPAPATPGSRQPGNPQPNGLAVSPDGKRLYVALGIRNAVSVLELPAMTIQATVPVGVAPYVLALSPDGRTLVVANRGGRRASAEERDTEPSAGTPVRVDPKTDAARRGSLSLIRTDDLQATEIEAGRQPAGMIFSADGRTLYVANSDEDTVSVVDVEGRRVRESLAIRPEEDPGFGQIPTDVALSQDGKELYVACGGANAVAVIDLGRPGAPRARTAGYLPAGWFPIGVAQRGGYLYVASSKGVGARPEKAGGRFGVHQSVGTFQAISEEARRDVSTHTRQVARNNGWGEAGRPRRGVPARPVPERVGEPSVFKHVVYIIKENHTYDLDLGDIPEGNGNASLTLFGEQVTPNEHALARQFVLLDNTYTSGTNSADGHQWTDSAVANGYIEQNYNAHSRSYPYDGGDPLAYSPEGFLWNAAHRKGLSVRVYGEFVNRAQITGPPGSPRPTWSDLWKDYKEGAGRYQIRAVTDSAALRPFLHPNYIGFPGTVSDQWRADQFLAGLDGWEKDSGMPSLCMLLLPNDHTAGTRPGMPTPRAAVADNDLALGRIVDRLSHSRFWRETLILVIEDDSQFGLDHIDGHRTVAFCVSPYTRRRAVVSEPYNHTSFLRTIGLVLGLPPMTRFDRTATPLTACFTETPDFGPYTHHPNRIPLDELNPSAQALRGEARRLAVASDRLDWSDIDRADAKTVAQAAWHSLRPQEPFPASAFHAVEDDD